MALGGTSARYVQGGARRDPTGPAGWYIPSRPTVPSTSAQPPYPPTPAHAGLPGPASLVGFWAPRAAGWVLPGIATRYTHPYTHPVPPMPVHPADGCTMRNSHFWTLVGEPRGIKNTLVSGSRAGIYPWVGLTRPFDWVLLSFRPVLLNYDQN